MNESNSIDQAGVRMSKNKHQRRRAREAREAKNREATVRDKMVPAFIERSQSSRKMVATDRIGPKANSGRYSNLSEKTKVLSLIQQIKDACGIVVEQGVYTLHRAPEAKLIKSLAETMLEMWPSGSVSQNAEGKGFKTLYWGPRTPQGISNCITRSSLYSDKILVVNPFVDEMLYHPNHSPAIRPEIWSRPIAFESLFLCMLEPWLMSDIVEVIPNPIVLDFDLGIKMRDLATKKAQENPALFEKFTGEAFNEMIAEFCMSLTNTEQNIMLRDLVQNGEKRAAIESLISQYRQLDPIRSKVPLMSQKEGVSKLGLGMNFDAAHLIASANECAILSCNTPFSMILDHESKTSAPPSFQQAVDGFSKIDLKFLNNVPNDFAVGVRNDGLLQRFRNYLLDLASAVKTKETQLGVQEFSDRFRDEYARYNEEWALIQSKLAYGAALPALGRSVAAGGTAAITTGNIGLALLSTMAWGIGEATKCVNDAVHARRMLEQKPLGLMLKLDQSRRNS